MVELYKDLPYVLCGRLNNNFNRRNLCCIDGRYARIRANATQQTRNQISILLQQNFFEKAFKTSKSDLLLVQNYSFHDKVSISIFSNFKFFHDKISIFVNFSEKRRQGLEKKRKRKYGATLRTLQSLKNNMKLQDVVLN